MSEKDPFKKPPQANMAFAVGDSPSLTHGDAEAVLKRTKELSAERIEEAGSYTKQSMQAVRNGEPGAELVNTYLISEARDDVEQFKPKA